LTHADVATLSILKLLSATLAGVPIRNAASPARDFESGQDKTGSILLTKLRYSGQ
jgi:hypothetical protein